MDFNKLRAKSQSVDKTFWNNHSRFGYSFKDQNPLDAKVAAYANEIRIKVRAGQTLTQIPFFCDEEKLSLLLFSFGKPIRNNNDILLIEHYLITFPNLMKTIYQKKYLYDASELLHKIAVYLKCEQIKKNTLICRLGEVGDKFYLIFQGTVAILIPREIKFKMSEFDFTQHLYHLFSLKEYELVMRTILSNNHIYMAPEIYQMKTRLESDENIYTASIFRENISIKDYIDRLNPSVKEDPSNPTITLWSYYYVTNITQGQTFGDIALSDDTKKRTASIISINDSYCGTLDITVYKNCIKDAQDRIRKMNINFLLSFKIFNAILTEAFDRRYFNCFKQISVKRGEYLIEQGAKRTDVFFLKSGLLEVSMKGCFQDINKVLILKGVTPDTTNEELAAKFYEEFAKFYYNKDKIFRIFDLDKKEILALDEWLDEKGQFLFSAKCLTEKAELFAIEVKLFNELITKEKRQQRLAGILEKKEKMMINRLTTIKETRIRKRLETLKIQVDNILSQPPPKIEPNEKNRKYFILEKFKFKDKRLHSASSKTSNSRHHLAKKTKNGLSLDFSLNAMSVETKTATKTMTKTDKMRRTLVSMCNVPAVSVNTSFSSIASKDLTITNPNEKDKIILRKIFDKEAKRRIRNEAGSVTRASSIDFLVVDKELESKKNMLLTRSESYKKVYVPKIYGIERQGKRNIKLLKIPKPVYVNNYNNVMNNK